VESQLYYITAMLSKIVTGGVPKEVICGICCLEGHPTDACPIFQEVNVNAIYSNQGQRKYDPILTLIIKNRETTLFLGIALKPIHLILIKHLVNLLIKA